MDVLGGDGYQVEELLFGVPVVAVVMVVVDVALVGPEYVPLTEIKLRGVFHDAGEHFGETSARKDYCEDAVAFHGSFVLT